MAKIFETITEIIGWLQIAVCPVIISTVIGAAIYFPSPSRSRLIIASAITVLGLIIGVVWATKVWKKKGTVWFLSRVMASPELDDKIDES